MTYSKYFSTPVPQTEPLRGREAEMKRNPQGGYNFISDSQRVLQRFLMLGSEGGSFYTGERKLTLDNAQNLMVCIQKDGKQVVDALSTISQGGLAPSNSPAIFALAACLIFGDLETRRYAESHFSLVIRTGTHMFELLEDFFALRGKGKSLSSVPRRALTHWFNRNPRDLAYILTKYMQREGWSNRDVLRLLHMKSENAGVQMVLAYCLGKDWHAAPAEETVDAGIYLGAVSVMRGMVNEKAAAALISSYNLPREVIPTDLLNSRIVWEALLEKMPITAMMRNLPKMTELGLLDPLTATQKRVVDALSNGDLLKAGRVHPLNILVALKTYASGASLRGSKIWMPVANVVDALDAAFYASFENIETIEENLLIALDVSGSMTWYNVAGVPLMPLEAEAAFAMCLKKAAPNAHILGFSDGLAQLDLSPRDRLETTLHKMTHTRGIGGGTDCSAPFRWAKAAKVEVDTFVLFTDSMTGVGGVHPSVARNEYSPASKWALVQTMATDTQIQDPHDLNALEFAGFSPAMYPVLQGFIRGKV